MKYDTMSYLNHLPPARRPHIANSWQFKHHPQAHPRQKHGRRFDSRRFRHPSAWIAWSRTERRLGEILAQTERNKGAKPGKTGTKALPLLDDTAPTLAALASFWRRRNGRRES